MRFALPPHVTNTETEHGAVLLNEKTGRYWQANDAGARVLRCLLDGGTAETAAAALRPGDPKAYERALRDVQAMIDGLRDAGLVIS
ncbi:lasso peptide biosynthesis PqqD family chaperone [Streptomyces sp. NPDC050703]|uniref:lasso peptide biosynthesis PqqD family chaperone n=1 Tax=Streptomyces sp. NPDC050703 TaxID=3157218 RepID=UPI00341CD95F